MELLDLLEERVRALVSEVKILRVQNITLQDELSACKRMIEDNKLHTERLQADIQTTDEVKHRLDALLQEVQNVLPR